MAFRTLAMQTDPALIQACRKGDRKAQMRLYDHCYGLMMSICIRYCKDRQEAGARLNLAFLKVLQHLDQVDPKGNFQAWVGQITLRTLIDEFRQQRRHYSNTVYNGHEIHDEAWMSGADTGRTPDSIDPEKVMLLINRLPEMTREVFNLFAIDGYAHKEIASMLAISENTSKWHVHDARRRLREALAPQAQTKSIS